MASRSTAFGPGRYEGRGLARSSSRRPRYGFSPQTEWRGKTTSETRSFISWALLTPERAADAIRQHWTIEAMHRVLDVAFKEDQSRMRRGHGARNMALVRRLAFNLVHTTIDPRETVT